MNEQELLALFARKELEKNGNPPPEFVVEDTSMISVTSPAGWPGRAVAKKR